MFIVSFDPGKTHWAYCFREDDKVLETGMLQNPIVSLLEKDLQSGIDKLEAEVKGLFTKWNLKPETTVVVAERFLLRPGRGAMGAVSEHLNFSLGLITAWIHPLKMTLITPALWKNYMLRTYGTNNMMQLLGEKDKKKIHVTDATGIGQFIYERSAGKKK
jgi:hypothetical protein